MGKSWEISQDIRNSYGNTMGMFSLHSTQEENGFLCPRDECALTLNGRRNDNSVHLCIHTTHLFLWQFLFVAFAASLTVVTLIFCCGIISLIYYPFFKLKYTSAFEIKAQQTFLDSSWQRININKAVCHLFISSHHMHFSAFSNHAHQSGFNGLKQLCLCFLFFSFKPYRYMHGHTASAVLEILLQYQTNRCHTVCFLFTRGPVRETVFEGSLVGTEAQQIAGLRASMDLTFCQSLSLLVHDRHSAVVKSKYWW